MTTSYLLMFFEFLGFYILFPHLLKITRFLLGTNLGLTIIETIGMSK